MAEAGSRLRILRQVEPRWRLHLFAWTPGQPTTFQTNDFDAVGVVIDPCVLKGSWPNLDRIVSSQPLAAACLTLDSELQWQGKPAYVYAVS